MRWLLIIVAVVVGSWAVAYQGWDMLARENGRAMLQGNDDSYYYFWIRSALIDRDFDFKNEIREAPTIDENQRIDLLAQPLPENGRPRNKYLIGWALVSAPFMLLGHGLALLTGVPADGWHPVYFICLWLGHLSLTVAGLVMACRLLAKMISREAAFVGVLVGWLASPLLYYQTARISMVHGAAFFLTVAVFGLSLGLRENPGALRRWLLLGASSALLVLTRATSVVYLLFPAWQVFHLLTKSATRSKTIRGVGWALFPALAFIAVQLFAWKNVYGLWLPDTYGDEGFNFGSPQIAAVLFSPQHGLFYWHPLLLLGAVAYLYATVRGRFPLVWLASLLLIIYLNASWWCWWFGSSFGNRAFEGAVILFMAGLGFLWEKAAASNFVKTGLQILFLIAILFNINLMGLYMTGHISRGDPVNYKEMYSATKQLLQGRQTRKDILATESQD